MGIPREHRLHPLTGAALFVICALWLIFCQTILVNVFGIYGSAISELFILAAALFPVAVGKVSFKDVFPMQRIRFRTVAGVFVLFGGSLLLSTSISYLTGYFFPEGMMDTAENMNTIMTGDSYWVTFVTVAVIAPICEEALFRGAILSAFSGIRSKIVLILLVGVLFGLMHMDPYRFLITASLGAILTYIAIETRNIFMPILLHFINNAFSLASVKIMELMDVLQNIPEMETSIGDLLGNSDIFSGAIVGPYLMLYGTAAPLIIFAGTRLLRGRREKTPENTRKNKRDLFIALGFSALFLLAGLTITILGFVK